MDSQEQLVKQVKSFMIKHGIVQKWLAAECKINEKVFSKFMHGKAYLSPKQVNSVLTFMNDFVEKHEGNKYTPSIVFLYHCL